MRIPIILACAAAVLAAVPAPAEGQELSSCQPIARPQPVTRPLNRREKADSVREAARRAAGDSMQSAVREAARRGGVAQPAGLVLVEPRGSRPERAEIHLWQANVPEGVVREVLATHGPLLGAMDRGITHFRLDDAPSPAAAGDAAVECPPRPVDVSQFVRDITRLSQAERPLPAGSNPDVRLQVRMLVTREGDVAFARLSRRTHQPALDEAILDAARRLRFVPARVGGRPVDVWVEQPVHLQLAVEPGRRGS